MDIHNSIVMDVYNSNYGYPHLIMDIHNYIMDIHNSNNGYP